MHDTLDSYRLHVENLTYHMLHVRKKRANQAFKTHYGYEGGGILINCGSLVRFFVEIHLIKKRVRLVDVRGHSFSSAALGVEPYQEFLTLILKPQIFFLCGYLQLWY